MDYVLDQLSRESVRLLVWGLMPRAIGLTFFIAYTSLWSQILPLLGSRGIDPVGLQFARIRADLPLLARLRLNPSLLWLARGDVALRVYIAAGILAACGMIYGGPVAWFCSLYCWAMWLSLQFSLRTVFPWETLLLESGFLCLFLPATQMLPRLAAAELPHPLIPFIFQLLVFRLLFGFGRTKFMGISRRDWVYTRDFLMNMPLCTPLGWRLSKLPDFVHKSILGGIAFVELVCPVLILLPGWPRLIAGVAIVGQMIGIYLTANYATFNLLLSALCLCTLDVSASLVTAFADPASLVNAQNLPFTLIAAFITLATPVYLIFNTWFNYGFLAWPAFERLKPGPVRAFLAVLRFVEPLRIVNGYGVFHARAGPPLRWVTVVEGSNDGREWKKYRYRHMMTDEHSRPRFVAPHHPRLDYHSFYDAVGVDGSGYLHPVSFSNPYLVTSSSLQTRVMQRVLEPGSPGAGLFTEALFGDRPPRLARVSLYRFSPATLEERAEDGCHWQILPIGLHLPPTEADERVWEQWMPPPELFHAEASGWRRRARVCRGINEQELCAFWDDFLPFVKSTAHALAPDDPFSWSTLAPLQREIRLRYTRDDVRQFHLTLGRLTMILMARLDAVFSRPASNFMRDVVGFGKQERPDFDPLSAQTSTDPERTWQALAAWPHGILHTRFHVWLAAQWVILDSGREGWRRLAGRDADIAGTGANLRTEARLSRRARRSMSAAASELGLELSAVLNAARTLTIARGMFLEGVVNYDMVAAHASRLRVLYSFYRYTPAPTGLFPGVFEIIAELHDQPAMCMMQGWGDETQDVPILNPPRMVYGDDRVWVPVQNPTSGN